MDDEDLVTGVGMPEGTASWEAPGDDLAAMLDKGGIVPSDDDTLAGDGIMYGDGGEDGAAGRA